MIRARLIGGPFDGFSDTLDGEPAAPEEIFVWDCPACCELHWQTALQGGEPSPARYRLADGETDGGFYDYVYGELGALPRRARELALA